MKKFKALFIFTFLLLCISANSQVRLSQISETSSAASTQPTYNDVLSGENAYSSPIYLAQGDYILHVSFWGHPDSIHLYTLYMDTNSHGSHAYVNYAGEYYLSLAGDVIIQFSFSDSMGSCGWIIEPV